MIAVLEAMFGLLPGFAYFHIVIWGLVGCLVAGFLSGLLWFARDEVVRAAAGGVIVIGLPVLIFSGLPGAGRVGIPVLLIAAGVMLVQHLRSWSAKRDHWRADAGLAILIGVSLLAIAFPYVMSIGS